MSTEKNTTQLTVTYERKFSDGNYGSEGLSLTYTATYEIGDDLAIDEEMIRLRCESLTRHLREAVLTELAGSAAERVRWAAKRELEPPKRVTVLSGADGQPESLTYAPHWWVCQAGLNRLAAQAAHAREFLERHGIEVKDWPDDLPF